MCCAECSIVSDSLQPCQAPLSMGILQARILEWVAMLFSRGSSQPRSSALQVDSLPSESPGKSLREAKISQNVHSLLEASLVAQLVKESICNAGDLGLIPSLGRSPGKGKGYPLQYSGLENSMDWIVHGVIKGRTRLSDFRFHSIRGKIGIKIQGP